MFLTQEEKRMLGGEHGDGVQKAMQLLVEYGEAFDAQRMISVDSSHILPDPLEWLLALTEGVKEFKMMTTIHAGSPFITDLVEALGLQAPEPGGRGAQLLAALEIYKEKGAFLTMSCAPYLMGNSPRMGQVFTWAGSSGIIINNSLVGARGNRESGVSMTCSAITGRTPDMLLTRPEGRKAEVLVRPRGLDFENLTEAELGAIGYSIGHIAQEKNVVIDTLPKSIPFDKMKYLYSPIPVSGAVPLCHITGVTPEAPTLEHALGGRKPEIETTLESRDIRDGMEQLTTAEGTSVDVVMLGCPHLTIRELGQISAMLEGKKISGNVKLWLNTNDAVYALAKKMGYADILDAAGAVVLREICIAMFPTDKMKVSVKNVATNSARCAHYMIRGGLGKLVGQTAVGSFYGSVEQCIQSALSGRWEG